MGGRRGWEAGRQGARGAVKEEKEEELYSLTLCPMAAKNRQQLPTTCKSTYL